MTDLIAFFANPFSQILNETKIKIAHAYENKLTELESNHSELTLKNELQRSFQHVKNALDESDLEDIKNKELEINTTMKPSYLIGGLYALIIILGAGFEIIVSSKAFFFYFYISLLVLVIYIYSFISCYFIKLAKLTHGKSFLWFVTIIILSTILINIIPAQETIKFSNANCLTFFAITNVFTPFILQFICVAILYLGEYVQLKKNSRRFFNKDLKKINRQQNSEIETRLKKQAAEIVKRHFNK